MSTSSINVTEKPVWIAPEDLPDGSAFAASLSGLVEVGKLSGTGNELETLFGHSEPSFDTPLDLMPAEKAKLNDDGHVKRIAGWLRSVLAHNFAENVVVNDRENRLLEGDPNRAPLINPGKVAGGTALIGAAFRRAAKDVANVEPVTEGSTETAQISSVTDQLAKNRARVGSAFLSDADKKNARLMNPDQDVTAPEAAKTRVISTVARAAFTDNVFVIKVMTKPETSPDDVILPSAKSAGFKGFIAHGSPVMTMNATARNRAAVSRQKHLSAVENPVGIKPEETAIFSRDTRVITIPPSLIDAGINEILDEADQMKVNAEADTVFTKPVAIPDRTKRLVFNGEGSEIYGHDQNPGMAELVEDTIRREVRQPA